MVSRCLVGAAPAPRSCRVLLRCLGRGRLPQGTADYAATLVESVSYLSQAALPVPAGASGLGPVPLLRRRITMILNDNMPAHLSWPGWALVLAAAVLLPLWPARAERPGEENNQTKQSEMPVAENATKNDKNKQPSDTAKILVEAQKLAPLKEADSQLIFLETAFDRLEHDFGIVKRGTTASHQFKLTNFSKTENASIGPVRVTNGMIRCTSEKSVLQPGDSTALTVSIDTKRFTGARNAAVYVGIGQGNKQTNAVLHLSVDSRDDAYPAPQAPQAQDARMAELEKKIDGLMKEVGADAIRDEEGKGCMPKDKQSKVGPLLSVSPVTLDLGKVRLGQPVQKEVKVYCKAPLRFKWLDGLDTELLVSAVETTWNDKSELSVLTFTFAPRECGAFKRTLRVLTNRGKEPGEWVPVDITVVAEVVQ